jgi:hypothetical protein
MSISHTTVDAAKGYAAEYMRERGCVSHEQDEHVKPQLYEFVRAIEKTLRVKTIPRCDKTVHVYREDDLMTMGYIGYGDFATSVHGDNKFIVCARGIENMKYCSSGNQHNMRMAIHMDTAVKHAKRHLVSYTVGECAIALVGGVTKEVNKFKNTVRNDYDEAIQAVGINTRGYGSDKKAAGRLMAELRTMVQSGHTFIDKELNAAVHTMFEQQEEANRFRDRAVPMDFVNIAERWGKQVVNFARIKDVTRSYHPEIEMARSYEPDELSEDMQHKCAAMSMCEDGHFVEGVGYKVNAHTFYLYV